MHLSVSPCYLTWLHWPGLAGDKDYYGRLPISNVWQCARFCDNILSGWRAPNTNGAPSSFIPQHQSSECDPSLPEAEPRRCCRAGGSAPAVAARDHDIHETRKPSLFSEALPVESVAQRGHDLYPGPASVACVSAWVRDGASEREE